MDKLFILLLVILVSTCVSAQMPATVGTANRVSSPPAQKVLIADETEIVASGKTGFRIITCNDTIAKKLMQKFEGDGMTKFTYTQKSDRHGKYWERSFYFKNESWNAVAMYINTELR